MNSDLLCLVGLGFAVFGFAISQMARPRRPDQIVIINPPTEIANNASGGCLIGILLGIGLILWFLVSGLIQISP